LGKDLFRQDPSLDRIPLLRMSLRLSSPEAGVKANLGLTIPLVPLLIVLGLRRKKNRYRDTRLEALFEGEDHRHEIGVLAQEVDPVGFQIARVECVKHQFNCDVNLILLFLSILQGCVRILLVPSWLRKHSRFFVPLLVKPLNHL
jgi:hypothetical protein